MDQEEICDAYYGTVTFTQIDKKTWAAPFFPERMRGVKPVNDIVDADTGEIIAEQGKKITPRLVKKMLDEGLVKRVVQDFSSIVGRYSAKDIINEQTGEIWIEAGDEITWELDSKTGDVTGGSLKTLLDNGITEIETLDIDNVTVGPFIRNTMAVDKNFTRETALLDIYRVMRPGEPPTVEAASALFDSLFFDADRYDLSAVGRVKMNMRLDLNAEDTQRTLRREDIIGVVRELVELRDGKGAVSYTHLTLPTKA